MGDLASRIMEELTCKTAFTIPVFGGIPIARICGRFLDHHGRSRCVVHRADQASAGDGTHQKTGGTGNGSHRTGAYF